MKVRDVLNLDYHARHQMIVRAKLALQGEHARIAARVLAALIENDRVEGTLNGAMTYLTHPELAQIRRLNAAA